jgi:hypothetical protein
VCVCVCVCVYIYTSLPDLQSLLVRSLIFCFVFVFVSNQGMFEENEKEGAGELEHIACNLLTAYSMLHLLQQTACSTSSMQHASSSSQHATSRAEHAISSSSSSSTQHAQPAAQSMQARGQSLQSPPPSPRKMSTGFKHA